jgi:hypothetical protein
VITFIVDNGLYYDAHGILFLDVPKGWTRDLDSIEAAINIAVSPDGFVIGRAESVEWKRNPNWVPGAPDEEPSQVFWDFVTACVLWPHPNDNPPMPERHKRREATKKLPKDFLRRLLDVWPRDAACRDLIEELVKS